MSKLKKWLDGLRYPNDEEFSKLIAKLYEALKLVNGWTITADIDGYYQCLPCGASASSRDAIEHTEYCAAQKFLEG